MIRPMTAPRFWNRRFTIAWKLLFFFTGAAALAAGMVADAVILVSTLSALVLGLDTRINVGIGQIHQQAS